ncbi:MAG: SDR family oxidoreductase [Gammaproteobacteria bacterium]|nr:SDR family oxidoreductase [Gammaproteobacteria bacterium]
MSAVKQLFGLAGKRALITGASGGLGSAIASLFADAGASLLLTDRDESALSALANSLGQHINIDLLTSDLADEQSVNQLCESLHRHPVDILVNCAGIEGQVGSLEHCTHAQWQQLMQINLYACQQLSAAVIPTMRERGFGRLIYVASIAGLRGNSAIGLYGVAKAALMELARNYAVQCGPNGITANAIAPGLIDTPLSRNLQANDAFMQRRLQMTPLRRIGHPDEIAATALYLASQAGAFTTGQTLVVDGGTLITDGN